VLHHNRERPLQQLRIAAYPFFTSETFNKKVCIVPDFRALWRSQFIR
jgi:hypothetical protein